MALLEIALAYTLVNEGGLTRTDAVDDKGGLSFAGITAKTMSAYLGRQAIDADMQMSMDTVTAVYRKLYWKIIQGDSIKNQAVATVFFDMAVLMGPASATKMMQQIVGATPDGLCGAITVAKINAMPAAQIVPKFSLDACNYFTDIAMRDATQAKWVRGWQIRAHKMSSLAIV